MHTFRASLIQEFCNSEQISVGHVLFTASHKDAWIFFRTPILGQTCALFENLFNTMCMC